MAIDFQNATILAIVWIAVGVYLLAIVYPVARILERAGFPPVLSVVALVPLLSFLALWWFAFARWPALKEVDEA